MTDVERETDAQRVLRWQRTGVRTLRPEYWPPVSADDRCDFCGGRGWRGLCPECNEAEGGW